MNRYKQTMKNLPFHSDFNANTIRLLNAQADARAHEKVSRHAWGYGRIALVACLLLVMLTTVAFAAVRILTPSEVAEYLGNTPLSEAFQSDGAVIVDEEIVVKEYTITLNGVVHGKDVQDYVEDVSSSYIVLSVRYTDGRTITQGEAWEDDPICRFTVSPYIHGKRPSEVNLFTLGSRANKCIIDNVLYILLETDTLSEFTGASAYLGVAESNTMAVFTNDEKSPFTLSNDGAVVLKEGFDEEIACAVFKLPL